MQFGYLIVLFGPCHVVYTLSPIFSSIKYFVIVRNNINFKCGPVFFYLHFAFEHHWLYLTMIISWRCIQEEEQYPYLLLTFSIKVTISIK